MASAVVVMGGEEVLDLKWRVPLLQWLGAKSCGALNDVTDDDLSIARSIDGD